jgi:gluconokinase
VGTVPGVADLRDVRQVVVMGVSGVGKSTVAKGISLTLGWTHAEGDAFHSTANVAKMASGHPLTDDDRWSWLASIGDWMSGEIAAGRSSVITCSALRRRYRDLLREGRPEVVFCHLVAGEGLVADRLAHRESHFMTGSLLRSQYETLEPLESDEPGVVVPVDGTAAEVLTRALDALGITPPPVEEGPP